MIVLGYRSRDKLGVVRRYVEQHEIKTVVVFSPSKFRFPHPEQWEWVDYPQIIKYRWFYRLLQEIDARTLLVINECLRTQNRSGLTYNCMRHYLQQTRHQIVFQYLPHIERFADFMTLLDWDTRSRWKGQSFSPAMLDGVEVRVNRIPLEWHERQVAVSEKTRCEYERTRELLFADIGGKDPHTIPRNLYLVTGKTKILGLDANDYYVGRNNRFKLPHMASYGDDYFESQIHTVFELPHNFIDFADFLTISEQATIPALTTSLKCDQWYWQRYQEWWGRVEDAYATLSG